ncbi:glycosyltransferase family 39 protein [Actinacidiphila acidipaludis]|uniref:Glycosyltransferase family 39 protein n=1 Tax=Actinacidiphila acidipaludis TaxID=2873382 RepID=A0ABS7QI55_9ACTN|nr:glycosyltransferase family 39 protein [Streptomyces acidipaludis]MBY8881612.1 glycosyltransferase family 39 protein [Streptomyces acidipaludis]
MASAAAESRSAPTGAHRDLRNRAEAALRHAAPALLGYGAARFLGIALLYYLAKRRDRSPGTVLYGSWDSRWYLDVAEHGYDHTVLGAAHTWHAWSNLAFFPLYPWLCRIADAVLPTGPARSAWAVSMAASFAAAWLIFLIGDRLYKRRTGIILAVLWGCLPHAVVESMAYTESLFTALCAAALYAALCRHWVRAGMFAALAGLTRPTGIALAAAVSAVAALAVLGEVRAGGPWWRRAWRPGLAVVLAPAGWLAFVAWVGFRLHRADGYFAVQAAWGNQLSKGGYLLRRIRWVFLGQRGADIPVAYVVVTLVVLACFALFALCVAQRQAFPLLLFSGALLAVVALGKGVYIARARFLLPAFPLLIPLARVLARTHRRTVAYALTTAALASAVYGVHLCLIWNGPP